MIRVRRLIQEDTRWPYGCFMKEEVVNDPKDLMALTFAQDVEALG